MVLKQFKQNPHHPRLHNHALRGALGGQRAVSVTGNIRIIFEQYDTYNHVTLLRIGRSIELLNSVPEGLL
jgi:mRNA-degrading endonuclease YafQ of YafQ-DinJ toxin-antitoxin module